MLSILIPIYNYNVTDLLLSICEEIKKHNIYCEILCLDDYSTNTTIKTINKNTCQNLNVELIELQTNSGRTLARQKLAKHANFDWLLFLDADVLPKRKEFILHYLNYIESSIDLIFGGFAYKSEKPQKEFILRWRYGHLKETLDSKTRQISPYKTITSANMLVKKTVFLNINSGMTNNWYGYDNYFSTQLKKHNYKIKHIDNEVYHLGLESNELYLRKKELAAETIYNLYREGKFDNPKINGLLRTFLKLKSLGLSSVYAEVFKLLKPFLKQNLLSKHPSMFILNLYRLGYFCSLTKKTS